MNRIGCSNDPIEDLHGGAFPRSPGGRDQTLGTGESPGRLRVDGMRIRHVHKSCHEHGARLIRGSPLTLRQERRRVGLARTAEHAGGQNESGGQSDQ